MTSMPPARTVPEHGGDIYGIARELGRSPGELVDFSASINPLGFPPGLPAALAAALAEVVHYPDRRCTALREELAACHGLSPDEILVGNGSTELIYLLPRALRPRRGLIVAPAFSEYHKALQAAGAEVHWHYTAAADGFTLREPVDPGEADLVFLANPASPSGALLPPLEMAAAVRRLSARGAWVVLDEAFIDFVEEASLKTELARMPRLLILRSFTKFFGIPGIRLGYLLAAPELVARVAAVQEPWSVSTLAQAAGRACLRDRDFMARSREMVQAARERFLRQLSALHGLQVFPSAANYLLLRITAPGLTAADLRRRLLLRGLIVRDASNFPGLDEGFVRVAVRRPEDNDRLAAALAEVLGEVPA
jgi:threonine-phosphate decarboxylase